MQSRAWAAAWDVSGRVTKIANSKARNIRFFSHFSSRTSPAGLGAFLNSLRGSGGVLGFAKHVSGIVGQDELGRIGIATAEPEPSTSHDLLSPLLQGELPGLSDVGTPA